MLLLLLSGRTEKAPGAAEIGGGERREADLPDAETFCFDVLPLQNIQGLKDRKDLDNYVNL